MGSIYLIGNYTQPTTAAPTPVATGTSLKTLLQVKPIVPCRITEWGISFDGFAAAAPGVVELLEVDVAATVTALAAGDASIVGPGVADAVAASTLLTFGTSSTGYTASAEGSITAARNLDAAQQVAPTTQFIKQFPLGEGPVIQVGKYGRIRVKFGTSVNALCYLKLEF
jgi:hypothetical protein